jgi:hypothetical protein
MAGPLSAEAAVANQSLVSQIDRPPCSFAFSGPTSTPVSLLRRGRVELWRGVFPGGLRVKCEGMFVKVQKSQGLSASRFFPVLLFELVT